MGADSLDLADVDGATGVAEPAKKGFWRRLKKGLFMTHTELFEKVEAAVSGRGVVDEETLEGLEEALIGTDIGVETAMELVEAVRGSATQREAIDFLALRERLVDEMATLLLDAPTTTWRDQPPQVTLVVGVNGVGKTTSIAKLAKRSIDSGHSVLLAAGDTFRAAAIDQLSLWGERLHVDVVKQSPGGDPAAVVFDALKASRARKIDHLIVDTAGRLHTKDHLMAELEKIKRVIDREAADWRVRTLLVLDATTGQNAVLQAREFTKSVAVDGLLLAKIDGTAKGGVVIAVARDLRLPVVFLGVGESADDLVEFRPRDFAAALLG